MAFFQLLLPHLFLLSFCATFFSVRADLCAFGCREFPQHQIVSSAQFRSFIMPRERGECVDGCCGGTECGGAGAAESAEAGEGYGGGEGTERKPKTDDGEGTEEEGKPKSALPDIGALLKALFPRQNAAEKAFDKKSVWYSTAVNGQRLYGEK